MTSARSATATVFATLAKRLEGLSFSELEQFVLDVQRRYVLRLPDSHLRAIVGERLKQWQHRFSADDAPRGSAFEVSRG